MQSYAICCGFWCASGILSPKISFPKFRSLMKKLLFLALVASMLNACSKEGPAGPAGPQGQQGTPGTPEPRARKVRRERPAHPEPTATPMLSSKRSHPAPIPEQGNDTGHQLPHHPVPVPEITADIINTGMVLVYVAATSDAWTPLPLTLDVDPKLLFVSFGNSLGTLRIRTRYSDNSDTGVLLISCKLVIVQGSSFRRSAPPSWAELRRTFGLPD